MKISQIQDHLAAAGYLDINFVKATGEHDVWGPCTAAAYENAVHENLHSFMTYTDLVYVATHQPDGDLDPNLVEALKEKAEKAGNALRNKQRSKKQSKSATKKARARKRKSRSRKTSKQHTPPPVMNTQTRPVEKVNPMVGDRKPDATVKVDPKPSIVTDKPII